MLITLKYKIFLLIKYNWLYIFLIFINLIIFCFINTFFSIWIIIELNLLIFLVILTINNNLIIDKLIKYYLLNRFSSIIFFFILNLNFLINNYLLIILINLCIIIKLGLFPFHIWFIDLIIRINWIICFFLSSTQKLIPIFFLLYYNYINLLIIISIIRGLIRILIIINQILLKKLIRYSSINHIRWILISIFISTKLFFTYYLRYILINLIIIFKFYYYNINEITDLRNYLFKNKIYIIFIFFSLGGLPPFYGFILKWFIIIYITIINLWIFIFILIIYSLIFLYFYIRLFINILLINYLNLKINYFINFKLFNNNFLVLLNLFFILNLIIFFLYLIY